MPEESMKFCASLSKCKDAYAIGAPGTVKIASDKAPVSEEKVNKILAFLAGKLSSEDIATMQDMMDDVVDEAEDLNPTKAMAKDGQTPDVRAARRAARRARRGGLALDVAPRSTAVPLTPAQRFALMGG